MGRYNCFGCFFGIGHCGFCVLSVAWRGNQNWDRH